MRRAIAIILLGLSLPGLFIGQGVGPARADTFVDLELVLAVDASGSVSAAEYGLQLSGIAAAITEQTATQLFLPNPRAQAGEYRDGFGLSGHEFDIVKSLPEHSRCVLIRKGGHSVVARLDLSEMPGALKILAGRERSVRELDGLRARVGDDPAAWLPFFLGKAADDFVTPTTMDAEAAA